MGGQNKSYGNQKFVKKSLARLRIYCVCVRYVCVPQVFPLTSTAWGSILRHFLLMSLATRLIYFTLLNATINPLFYALLCMACTFFIHWQFVVGMNVAIVLTPLPLLGAIMPRNLVWKWLFQGILDVYHSPPLIIDPHMTRAYTIPTLFSWGPHGLIPLGIYVGTEGQQRSVLHAASIVKYVPLMRLFLFCARGRFADVTEACLLHTLKTNHAHLYPGGVQEASLYECCNVDVYFTKHRGFCRIAKQCGVCIVPVIVIGESHGIKAVAPKLSQYLYTHWKIPLMLGWCSWGKCPPLKLVYGKPIQTGDRSLEDIHQEYVTQLRSMVTSNYKDSKSFRLL